MNKYRRTVIACFLSLFTQAVCAMFITLLYNHFYNSYGISYTQLSLISTVFFFAQLLTDFFCAKFVEKIGQRKCIIASEVLCALGLILFAVLPNILPSPFIGILISVLIYAVGSGLIEVLASPIIEACPFKNKDKIMSILHSFYSWGVVITISLSSLFFYFFGIENWPILSCIFALIPIYNIFNFATCPLDSVTGEEKGLGIKELFKLPSFWLSIILMIGAGASEIAMHQWASAFVESSLGFSKNISDLIGPCLFAIFMGLSRIIYAKFGEKIKLEYFMIGSGILCLICYLLVSLSTNNIICLISCVICGFSIGIMWPGTISISSKRIPRGGISLFAFLALAGDLGGVIGPSTIGLFSDAFGSNLKQGLLPGIIFPIMLIIGIVSFILSGKRTEANQKKE